MDFLDNDFLAAHVALVDLQIISGQPDSPVIRVEDEGFDLQSHLVYQIAKDPVKKRAAERKILGIIRTYLNQGKDSAEIEADFNNDPAFLAVFGKNFSKNLARFIEKSKSWDEHKNQVEIFFNLLCHTYQAAQSKKIQKDTKRVAPLMMLIPALTTALSMNRTAISASMYIRNVGSILALSEELDEKNQKRKWLAYEKLGFIKFYPGKRGGDSNRVEILVYAGPQLTIEQKLEAAEIILSFITHDEMHQVLKAVLYAVASMEGAPRYNDCDLGNKVEDLLAVFAPIAGAVVETRKAERLIESADFESAVQAEATELADKVDAHLKSGNGFQPRIRVVAAPQRVSEPRTAITRPSLRAQAYIAAEKLSKLHGSQVATKQRYTAGNITAGLEF